MKLVADPISSKLKSILPDTLPLNLEDRHLTCSDTHFERAQVTGSPNSHRVALLLDCGCDEAAQMLLKTVDSRLFDPHSVILWLGETKSPTIIQTLLDFADHSDAEV